MPRAIKESHANATENYMIGETIVPLSETFMGENATMADIYRFGLSEYGRCISKVYIDTKNGVKHVGYCFQKRQSYEDSKETYIHEVWITIGEHVPAVQEHLTFT